jgi:hypothetical protein
MSALISPPIAKKYLACIYFTATFAKFLSLRDALFM